MRELDTNNVESRGKKRHEGDKRSEIDADMREEEQDGVKKCYND